MKKIDFLKSIETLGDEDDILDTLKEHEEIKGLAKPFDANLLALEDFTKLLQENQKINGYWTSEKDRAVSKGVEAFKTNKVPSLIETAIKAKSNEGKSPEQIQLEEQIKENQKLMDEIKKSKLMTELTPKVAEMGLPIQLMNYILDEDEEKTLIKASEFKAMFDEYGNGVVNKRLNTTAPQPPSEATFTSGPTKEDFAKMSYKEKTKLFEENKELYNQLTE